LLLVLLDELFLLVGIGFPEEAGDLVVTDADAFEQLLDSTGRVADGERLLDPAANLIRVAKATGADFLFELCNLMSSKFTRITLVMESAESIESFIAIDTKPFAQLGEADPQQVSDFFPAFALGNGQDGSEALVDTPVEGPLASSFEFPPLLRAQDDRLHG